MRSTCEANAALHSLRAKPVLIDKTIYFRKNKRSCRYRLEKTRKFGDYAQNRKDEMLLWAFDRGVIHGRVQLQ